MSGEKSSLGASITVKSGEVVVGAGVALLVVGAVDSVVGGPIDRSTERLSEGANTANQEFFPYDVGLEMAGSMLTGALVAAKLFSSWRRSQ